MSHSHVHYIPNRLMLGVLWIVLSCCCLAGHMGNGEGMMLKKVESECRTDWHGARGCAFAGEQQRDGEGMVLKKVESEWLSRQPQTRACAFPVLLQLGMRPWAAAGRAART